MTKRWTALLLCCLVGVLLVSCNMPSGGGEAQPTDVPPQAQPTDPPPKPANTSEPEPTTDPYADIVHTDMPGNPVLTYWAYDCDTGRYTEAADKPAIGGGCDVWANNYVERPLTKDMSIFYPHLDIVRFQMGKDESWLYADLQTYSQEGVTTEMNGSYALELDFDSDGEGDVLLLVNDPSQFEAGEWHALGVEVWEDTNDDLGSDTPVLADAENTSDGYETQLFDQGLGDDPDLAWARIAPEEPVTVEFAIKRSIIPNGVGAFVWWTWASQLPLEPGKFDIVDSYGEDEVYQIGNSCRWIFDGPPQQIPNVCPYGEPERPDRETTYCWVRNMSPVAVFPTVCQVCPNPCPAGYNCWGTCTP